MSQFGWQHYLIERGLYADWVDHGRRRPTHRQWSAYLRAVADKLASEVTVGEVVALDIAGERWQLRLDVGDVVEADGILLSGTGPPETVPGQPPHHPRVRDGRDYWLTGADALAELRPRSVCVVGNGETAAAVVIDLLENLERDATVEVLTSRGVLYSRGESYHENRLYSDPSEWPRLAEAHRREFLEHTDRGVFSQQAETTLNHARGFRTLPGRAIELEASDHQVVITVEYGAERELVAYDLVVVAIGFDARWFEPLLGAEAQGAPWQGACRPRPGTGDRCRPRRLGTVARTASAGVGRADAGTGLPEPQLPRPLERSRPASLHETRSSRETGTRLGSTP